MANYKITDLTELSTNPDIGDWIPLVDVSDTTMASTGTTKRFNAGSVFYYNGTSGFRYLGSVTIGNVATNAFPFEVRSSTTDAMRLASVSATGNPLFSFGQGSIRRSFIQHVDTGDVLTIASEFGAVAIKAASTAGSGLETEYLRVDVGGNVGIGTDSPSAKLDVAGTVQMDALRIDQTPEEGEFTATHFINVDLNGTNYRIACAAY